MDWLLVIVPTWDSASSRHGMASGKIMQHLPGVVVAESAGPAVVPFRRSRWLIQWSIVALVGWGIWRSLASVQADLVTKQLDPRQFRWPWFMAAAACYFVAQIPTSTFWRDILSALGQPSTWATAFRAFFIGHLGKYVPSKLLVVAIRAAPSPVHTRG